MRFVLVLFLFPAAAAFAQVSPESVTSVTTPTFESRLHLTLGLGLDSRLNKDVNPDDTSLAELGNIYLSVHFQPWSILWEVESAQSGSSVGDYSVRTTSLDTMIWGRYEPWSGYHYLLSPYAGLGLGWALDHVTTDFGSAHDSRWADGGGIAAVSAGLTATFFQHWNVEGEMRYSKLELAPDPVWGFVVRSGYTF